MDTAKIISFLNQSASIGSKEMVELSSLKKEFPWFSTLYHLEAKCLKNENKFGLKKTIKTASLFAGDREVLYDFMHDSLAALSANNIPTQQPTKEKVEKPVAKQKTIAPQTEAPKTVEVKSVEKEEPKPIAIKTEEKLPPVKKPAAKKIEVKKPKPKELVKPTIVYDPLVELQSKIVKPEEPIAPTKVYDPLVELPKLEKKKPEKKRDKQDFFSWLDSLEDEQPKEEPKPRKLKMSAEASALLENFIKNRPSISRIRTDIDRTEVHKASPETRGNEIVTESLAQLHLKQGRPEKAIEIYEKLRLQNPQKFSYFAALIEKIKQENNLA